MSSLPTAHLIHGFLGVGKTTFARRLEQQRRAVRFTHDEWVETLFGRDPPAELFVDMSARVSAVMERTWTRCLQVGTSVVLDLGYWTRADRLAAMRLARQNGGTPMLYRLDCPDNVAMERIERRNRSGAPGLYISPATYRTLRANFEPLGEDESCIEVSPHET
ncbi:AAA family ATPase [Sphingomonas citri]|uniref:AAA family ATPase n=1 Tax=Sphingomonas citri TaxID=2862499 RepID=A0ABS7BKU2_9SPHN|nr:AAA family ATPase [Sphingomonas citri]MBW6530200.1 AAA family ATPase [Sphingomonas citri]